MRGPRGIPLIPFALQGGRPGLVPPHDPARRPQEQARQFRMSFAGRWEPSIFRRFRLVPYSFSVSRIVSQTGRTRSASASSFLSMNRMEPPSPGLMVQSPRRSNCIAPASATNTLLPGAACEVVSPSDTAAELERKASEYLEAGSQRVWVVYPESRRVKVYRPDGTARCYSGDDAVTDEELSPGFS